MKVDLNADVGEGLDDAPLISCLTSVNIACGAHAGDDETIARSVALAIEGGVKFGAHPSYPDRENFGRVAMEIEPSRLEDSLARQIERVWRAGRAQRAGLSHVKPHGALYHAACRSLELAEAVASAVRRVDPTLVLVGPPQGLLLPVAREKGLRVAAEGFADRRYLPDGQLAPRSRPDALLTEPGAAAAQALQLVAERSVTAVDGSRIPLEVQTLCVHGDTPGAVEIARAVRAALESKGVEVVALGR